MSSKLLSAIAVGIAFAFAGCSGGGSGTTAATPSTGGETQQTPAAALQTARAAVATALATRTASAIASARTALAGAVQAAEAAVRRARAELDEAEGDAARSEAQAALTVAQAAVTAAQDYQTEQTAALQRLQVVGSSPTAPPSGLSIEFPDWLITNVANARSALDGGTLNWDREKMISEYSMVVDDHYGSVTLPYVANLYDSYIIDGFIEGTATGPISGLNINLNPDLDFQPIGKHSTRRGGISFFEIRYKNLANVQLGPLAPLPLSERDAGDESNMIMGISDSRLRTNNKPSTVIWIARDSFYNAYSESFDYYDPSGAPRDFLRGGFISNEPYSYDSIGARRGTYTGAMLGIKHDRLSAGESFTLDTFNHEYITGDATVTIAYGESGEEETFEDWEDINVEFSDIRNLNTGRPVEISKTEFEYRTRGSLEYDLRGRGNTGGSDFINEEIPRDSAGDLNSFSCTACIRVHFGGENDPVVSGGFAASDAFGVFSASKLGATGRLFER